MKNKKRIYDRQELLDLVNKDHSCIILKHCNRKIELQAKYSEDVKAGIKEALDTGLNKFDYSLNGFLLDYRNLNVLADKWTGRIVGRFGEFLVNVNAEFFIFNPQIGSLLEGVVNAKSDTHVGCLVHKRFNAMILKPDVEDNWNCENIQIGDKIIFTIVDHVSSTNIPHIEGVLANQYLEKSSENSKKELQTLGNQTQDLSKNGKYSDEQDILADSNKKSNKLDGATSSTVENQGENNLADTFGDKPQKSKCKKRKIDPMDAIVNNMMDVEESLFEVKKKKKKKKEKDQTMFKTEKTLGTSSASSEPLENPASVFSETMVPINEAFQVKHKKKKRDKEKEFDISEPKFEHKKKKKKDKNKNSENNESVIVEAAEKKHQADPESIEETLPKGKKKKKREKECSPLDFVKTSDPCELSQSNKNRLCTDDNTEANVNPVDLIDELLNVVPTDLILPGETTPIKGTGLEKVKSPKSSWLSKKETSQKSQTPSKKKQESITLTTTGTYIDNSSRKKRNLEDSLKSPKSVKLLDKSLFSDSETCAQSPPKPLPKPVILDVGSSQLKLGVESSSGEALTALTENALSKPNNVSKKEKKPKGENLVKSDENKSKTIIKDVHEKSNEMKSSTNKKEKKDIANKSVTWEVENTPTSTANPKSTLLQRFEMCLGNAEINVMTSFTNKSKTTIVKNDVDKTSQSSSKVKEKKLPAAKGKAKEAGNEEGKLDDYSGISVVQGKAKMFSLDGVDDTQLNNPVKTSTPKTVGSSSDKYGGKIKNPKTKIDKKLSKDVGDAERASMINALLEQAKKSLGIDHLFRDSSQKCDTSIKWRTNSSIEKPSNQFQTSLPD